VFSSGVTFSACAALLDVHGHGHNAAGLGSTDGDPDAVGFPIPGTLVPVPWASSPTAQCLLDMRDAKTNEPLWFDPRKILGDVVAGLHAQGLYPVVACELEFYLIDSERTEKGGIRPSRLKRTSAPPHSPQNLGLDAVEEYADFISAVESAASLQHIPATTAVAEYGLGQFEINLQHGNDPVLAADQAVLLKRLIRGVARSQGHDVTFMGKPYMDQPGSGLHVHVSLCDKDGRNLFGSKEGEPLFYHAIAGMQAMLAESGIRIKFDVVDASQFNLFRRPPYRGDYLMARWGGRADPLQVFQELIATGATYNPVGVASPEIDTLVEKARGLLPDDPARLAIVRQIGRVGVENVANMPLMTRSNVYAFKPGCILGLVPFLAIGDDRFNDVQIAAKCK
jgi:hypothetical protein